MGLFGHKENAEYEKIKEYYTRYKALNYNDLDARNEILNDLVIMLDSCDRGAFKRSYNREAEREKRFYLHPVFGANYHEGHCLDNIRRSLMFEGKILESKIKFRDEAEAIDKYDIAVNSGNKLKRNKLFDMPEIKTTNITKTFNIAKYPCIVIIDTETTGLKASGGRIVQLSAIRIEEGVPVETFNTLINPLKEIPEDATRVNGITNDDVKDCPTIGEVAESFMEFVGSMPIAGYNLAFDLKFLFCSGIDLIDNRKMFDVYELCKKTYKGLDGYKLTDVCSDLRITYPAHNSLYDCLATWKVLKDIIITKTGHI